MAGLNEVATQIDGAKLVGTKLNEKKEESNTRDSTDKDSSVKDYFTLTKPSVTLLVVISCITGMVVASSNDASGNTFAQTHPLVIIATVVATALGSASAAVFNMWYDRDIDSVMKRTKHRPIVREVVHPDDAIVFSFLLGAFALMIMFLFVNVKASVLLLVSILFYVIIYTCILKRSTIQNIVIGGAAGSFPPVIGWTSVTNSIDAHSFILFLLIFFWTPPHFWALALHRKDDYSSCNVPMMPCVKGDLYTKKQILIYTVITFIVSLLPFVFKISGILYLCVALIAGFQFLKHSLRLLCLPQANLAIKLFGFSITYLFILLFGLILDHYTLHYYAYNYTT